ncbi:efflux RND transporter periplasmic adaptor subunit [Halosquirtibacter laminarini]|uniref:Efflux RND transporter periplasmic adaptor subunit n=1 Tax=Halosquirtibacter laminarini TaxID=3374600 RepID=A0AC61NQY5_9BACT|nr:efflux RND transporter periplasmic adaptor subunit [Prolixibacteraceae bacterium]
MRKIIFVITVFIGAFAFLGCSNDDKVKESSKDSSVARDVAVPVNVAVIKKQSFDHTFRFQGVVKASKNIVVSCSSTGVVHFKREIGQSVKKGEVIVSMSSLELRDRLDQAKIQLDKSNLSYMNSLLGRVHQLKDSVKLDKGLRGYLELQSGLTESKREYASLLRQFKSLQICASFDGQITEVLVSDMQKCRTGTELFRYVPQKDYQVSFKILESDLQSIHLNDTIEVDLIASNQKVYGKVKQISPQVDGYGFIHVVGTLTPKSSTVLMDGMHATISVKHTMKDQVVVPKEVVLRRSGKRIVFVKHGKEAAWKYVHIKGENDHAICIEKGLKAGDSLIVSNYVNLAHHSDIVLDHIIEL